FGRRCGYLGKRELEPACGPSAKVCDQLGKCADPDQKRHVWYLCRYRKIDLKRKTESGAPHHAFHRGQTRQKVKVDFLHRHIEALIFCAPEPLAVAEISKCLGEMFAAEVPLDHIESAIYDLRKKY